MSNIRFANTTIALGALGMFFAVAAGAFGAHGLKNTLSIEMLKVYQTAADYQFIHAIGLIFIGVLHKQAAHSTHKVITAFILSGIILFCGSLYALSLTGIKSLGMITPIGGICFLIAWLLLAILYFKRD